MGLTEEAKAELKKTITAHTHGHGRGIDRCEIDVWQAAWARWAAVTSRAALFTTVGLWR